MSSPKKSIDANSVNADCKSFPLSIAIITSQANSLVNFRGALILDLVARGVKIYALAPDYTAETRKNMHNIGAIPVNYSLGRATINPFRDIIDTWKLFVILRKLRPDATLTYFIKPVIYGTVAAWFASIPHRYALIEGLGFIFMDDERAQHGKRRLLKVFALILYRFALARADRVILLNSDDLLELTNNNALDLRKAVVIPGIGVDLSHFHSVPAVTTPITFLLVARMLREKGVYVFVEAARIIKGRYPGARFLLVGGTDANPGSVNEAQLRAWNSEGIVEWTGPVNDVRTYIAQSSVFVLPSFREGFPRSTQEAMAMGRPVITTNAPGCRETVTNLENGFVVPVRNPVALGEAMQRFIQAPELIATMGAVSRRFAEARFDVRDINLKFLTAMKFI